MAATAAASDGPAEDKERLAKEKLERVKAGLEEAKRKQKEEQRSQASKKQKVDPGPTVIDDDFLSGLYGGLPEPDPDKDKAFAERQKKKVATKGPRLPALPAEDVNKVIFLDIDGVLRPLTAGGFRAMMVDGEFALKADTSDFMSSAMLSLRHIIEKTGAVLVLSSEWRRNEPMREGVDNILREYEMPPCASWTPTDLDRDLGTENPFQAFTERRAREISGWLQKNQQVRQWVVLDDINMANADEDRRPGTLRMTERIVQTHRKIGLTMENAQAAVRMLNGEKLPPQILEVQPHVELV